MAKHPNVARLSEGFEIRRRLPLAPEDRAAFDAMLLDGVVWHGTGKGPWARDFVGKPAVFGLFDEMSNTSAGTLTLHADSVYADDTHGVIIARLHANFGGREKEWTEAQVFHMRDGKIDEFWGIPDEQESVDAFFFGG